MRLKLTGREHTELNYREITFVRIDFTVTQEHNRSTPRATCIDNQLGTAASTL